MADDIAKRVKDLRRARGMTQEELAHAGGLERVEVVSIETGKNQAGTARVRKALAKGARVGLEDLFKYLDGEMELEELLSAEPSTHRPPSGGAYPNRTAAVCILREARFAVAVLEELEREAPDRDRTIYAWIKRAEAIASEIPPPSSTPSAPTKPSAPPTPPKTTRRSHR